MSKPRRAFAEPRFLTGGGEMGARIRAHDWAATPLGPPGTWPQPLRTLMTVMLGSGQPMFVAWGPERTMLYNDGYAPMCGVKHPLALARPFAEVWADIIDTVGPIMDRAYAGVPTHMDDIQLTMRDRRGYPEETHFSFSYTPVRDESGEVAGMLCACTETTDRIFAARREQFLFGLTERLRGLSDPLEVIASVAAVMGPLLRVGRFGFAEVDSSGRWTTVHSEWNDGQMPTLRGRHNREAYGPAICDAFAAGRVLRLDDVMTDPLTAGSAAAYLAIGMRAGLIIPLVKNGRFAVALYAHQAEPRRWQDHEVALMREVAERTWEAVVRAQSETALRESEARLRALDALGQATRSALDPGTVMAATASTLGAHLGATAATYAEIGPQSGQVTAQHDWTTGSPGAVARFHAGLFGPVAAGEIAAGRAVAISDVDREVGEAGGGDAIRALGVKALLCSALVVDGRLMAVLTAYHVEPHRWLPADVALVKEALERSWVQIERLRSEQKLRQQDARKDEFLATLAHELRNPLAPLLTGLQLLKLGRSDERVTDHVGQMMTRQVGHMVRLVDDLLDVSRVSRGAIELRRERLDLKDVIASAVETSLPLIEAGRHQLTISLADGPLPVEADATRLAQVFSNLLNNAAKYMADGGRIAIGGGPEGRTHVVRIADTGVGIPPEELDHIFDMFRQVGSSRERSQGGLGIGLTLVRRLTQMHGGTVSAESAGAGCGSTFTVRLPVAEPFASTAPDAGQARVSREPRTRPALRVLVVDDNADAAEMLALLIHLEGHDTATAQSGSEALSVAQSFNPQVVFLDIGLPGLDGYQVARRLRERADGTALLLVALTGWGSEADKQRTRDAGFDHHMTKPVDAETVRALIDQAAMGAGGTPNPSRAT